MLSQRSQCLSSVRVSQVKPEDSLATLLSCMLNIGCVSPPTVPHSLSLASEVSSPTPKLVENRSSDTIGSLKVLLLRIRKIKIGDFVLLQHGPFKLKPAKLS